MKKYKWEICGYVGIVVFLIVFCYSLCPTPKPHNYHRAGSLEIGQTAWVVHRDDAVYHGIWEPYTLRSNAWVVYCPMPSQPFGYDNWIAVRRTGYSDITVYSMNAGCLEAKKGYLVF